MIILINITSVCINYASASEKTSPTKSREAENTVSLNAVSAKSLRDSSASRTILVMGDSISAAFGVDKSKGWVALLKKELNEQLNKYNLKPSDVYNFINASISGETTTGARNRMTKALSQYQPDLVIIELGGNDGLRGTPIKYIETNIRALITQSQQNGAKVMLLGMRIPPNYGDRYTGQFSDIYARLAAEYDTLFVPFFMHGLVGEDGMMQDDGIHPTQKAQPIMMKLVQDELKVWLNGLK